MTTPPSPLTYENGKEYFWASAAEGALQLPFCLSCSRCFFFPRSFCPQCWSDNIEWRAIQGIGEVWSYTIVRFGHGNVGVRMDLPYVLALIQLPEGVRLMSNVVDCDVDEVHVGMPVTIAYRERESRTLPLWIPIRK